MAQGQSPISKLVPVRPNLTKGKGLQTNQALLCCSIHTEITQFGRKLFRFWDGWVSISTVVEVLCRQVYCIQRLWSCNLLELVHSRLNHRCSILLPSPGRLNIFSALSSLHFGQMPTHLTLQKTDFISEIFDKVSHLSRDSHNIVCRFWTDWMQKTSTKSSKKKKSFLRWVDYMERKTVHVYSHARKFCDSVTKRSHSHISVYSYKKCWHIQIWWYTATIHMTLIPAHTKRCGCNKHNFLQPTYFK